MSLVQSKSAAINTPAAGGTVSWDTPATAGNLLVIIVAADDYVSAGNRPSGFTQSIGCGLEGFLGHYLWWKVAAGGETSASYTLGASATSCWITAEISGLTASPYDISDGLLDTGSGNTYTTPTIIPTTGQRYLIGSIGGSLTSAFSGVDTWLNSFIERQDVFTTLGSGTRDQNSYADISVTGDSATGFSTGATYSGSVSANQRTGIIIAFKVASGGNSSSVSPSVSASASRSLSPSASVSPSASASPSSSVSPSVSPSAAQLVLMERTVFDYVD